MDFFLQNFLSYTAFGSALSGGIPDALTLLVYLFIILACLWGIGKMAKWEDMDSASTRRELRFQKAKWDAIESSGNKRLRRFGAHVGWEGIGVEYEHDNRRGKR